MLTISQVLFQKIEKDCSVKFTCIIKKFENASRRGGDLNSVQEGKETESPLQQINPFKSKKKSAGGEGKIISIKEVTNLEVENEI